MASRHRKTRKHNQKGELNVMRPKLIFEDKIKPYIEKGKLEIRDLNTIIICDRLTDYEYRKISKILRKFGYKYFGGFQRGWFRFNYSLPPIIEPDHWDLINREYIKHGAQYTIKETFQFIKDGDCTWIVPVSGNPNAIYFHTPDNEHGFGGATLTFLGMDGKERQFRGPWHSNAKGLYERTGIDLRKIRKCPFNHQKPEECPYYCEGLGYQRQFACKKRLHPFDDDAGEECVLESTIAVNRS